MLEHTAMKVLLSHCGHPVVQEQHLNWILKAASEAQIRTAQTDSPADAVNEDEVRDVQMESSSLFDELQRFKLWCSGKFKF